MIIFVSNSSFQKRLFLSNFEMSKLVFGGGTRKCYSTGAIQLAYMWPTTTHMKDQLKSFDLSRDWSRLCILPARQRYKVVQIWPGRFVCKQVTVCPGHIWTTLYIRHYGKMAAGSESHLMLQYSHSIDRMWEHPLQVNHQLVRGTRVLSSVAVHVKAKKKITGRPSVSAELACAWKYVCGVPMRNFTYGS